MSQDGAGAADYIRQQFTNPKKFQQRTKDFQLPAATDRYSWDRRRTSPNTTPASTVLNSPDLIEVHYQHQHQIKVGRSPVSQQNDRSDVKDLSSSGGGVEYDIIFDDIADNWKTTAPPAAAATSSQITFDNIDHNFDDNSKVMEYDSSPRRFGNYGCTSTTGIENRTRPNSRSTTNPRPGFPQRITSPVSDDNNYRKYDYETMPTATTPKETTFDYLYEFSETRKVLEDFFRTTTSDDDRKSFDDEKSDTTTSNVYNSSACAYIGQRLANNSIDDTFHTCGIENNFILSGGGGDNLTAAGANEIELYLDSNSQSSVDLTTGGVDGGCNDSNIPMDPTEIEKHINHQQNTRHFTVSPESGDFDSNCGDRSINDASIVQTDYGRLCTSMPILEDGLSSGHASDTDNNNINFAINVNDDHCDREVRQTFADTDNIEEQNPVVAEKPLTDVEATLRDIRTTLQRTKTLLGSEQNPGLIEYIDQNRSTSPIWIPRHMSDSQDSINSDQIVDNIDDDDDDDIRSKALTPDDEEADTDLETDRLLGQQRLDDQGFNEERNDWRGVTTSAHIKKSLTLSHLPTTIRQGIGTAIHHGSQTNSPTAAGGKTGKNVEKNDLCQDAAAVGCSPIKSIGSGSVGSGKSDSKSPSDSTNEKKKTKEGRWLYSVLIEGVLFRAKYLGSTQLLCEGQPTKSTRMLQAEEAVSRIKAPEGESQPSTEVDLFISTEKIMVLNTDLKEIMMDHSLRTISYIADIGDLVVLMARRRFVSNNTSSPQQQDTSSASQQCDNSTNSDASATNIPTPAVPPPKQNRTPKMICHVFESDEAQFIAQSIGQAFQVAYMEFLKANGIEDHSFVKEMDYQEVLNSQEIFGDELEIFAKKELQKEIVVPKLKGEILGIVVVESGWGSMLPTVVIANLLSTAAAARCGQLNIGDQIIAINGLSLVGLPLSTCQSYIRNTKNQSAVKFTVVPCPPVVEVKIKRPNTKYQLGFSVQNGVICSLLRGGIAERGGVRVGHRIIEINNQSVVAVPHEKIVSLLATSVGEILMKTMPTSMFRLLTGQENPLYI